MFRSPSSAEAQLCHPPGAPICTAQHARQRQARYGETWRRVVQSIQAAANRNPAALLCQRPRLERRGQHQRAQRHESFVCGSMGDDPAAAGWVGVDGREGGEVVLVHCDLTRPPVRHCAQFTAHPPGAPPQLTLYRQELPDTATPAIDWGARQRQRALGEITEVCTQEQQPATQLYPLSSADPPAPTPAPCFHTCLCAPRLRAAWA